MHTLTVYYDKNAREFYDPFNYGRRSWWLAMPNTHLVRLRLAVTKGKATVDSDGAPATAYRYSIADQADVVFSIKTKANWLLGATGDLSHATSTLDTTDTAWHYPEYGQIAHQFAIASTVTPGQYVPEITLLDTSDVKWPLISADCPLTCDVLQPVYTGSEASAPAGSTAGNWYTGTVLAGSDTVDITITGMTATGKGIPAITGGSALSTIAYTAGTNKVTITLGGTAPTGGIPVAFMVKSLT